MSKTLNNAETANEPAAKATLEVTTAACLLELDVYNSSIYLQLLTSPDGDKGTANWQAPLFVAPSHRAIVRRNIFGARAYSAVDGVPAQVTMELVWPNETFLAYLIAAPATN